MTQVKDRNLKMEKNVKNYGYILFCFRFHFYGANLSKWHELGKLIQTEKIFRSK